ncbi:hypothetical protein FRC17_004750, partial [Serendipita sp. 399]
MGALADSVHLEEKQPLGEVDYDVVPAAATSSDESDAGDETDEDPDTKGVDLQNTKIRIKDIDIWRIYYQETPWRFVP